MSTSHDNGVSVESEVVVSELDMDVDVYQDWTIKTAIYPGAGNGSLQELLYLGLGLNGEAGEVAEKIKKIYRDHDIDVDVPVFDVLDGEIHEAFVKELTDCLYYLCRLAKAAGVSMSTLAGISHSKLSSRLERGVIGGSGDDR